MPVKYGILIYVSHLGSRSLPCRATRWTSSGTSRGTSTGQETQSILAVFLRDINLFGHVECLNGLRGGHAHGHRDPGDGQPQQGHVPHHDQGVQHSLTFQLAKNIHLFIGSVLDWQIYEHKTKASSVCLPRMKIN